MSDQYVLGIDVGTSSAKVGLVSPDGTLKRVDSEPYPMYSPRPGWAEQQAEDWWMAVQAAVRRVMVGVDPASVGGIGFSNAGGSMVVLDERLQPVRPAMVWMDARAGEQGERLLLDLGRDFWISHTGQFLVSFWPVSKILWLREHEPQVHAKIAFVLQSADYCIYRMTGRLVTDRCNACATGLYNLQAGKWDSEILSAVGIPASILPELGDSGTVAGGLVNQAASELGLQAGTPVVLGAWDQACAVLGAGSTSGQDALLSTGTAWVLSSPVQELRIDSDARTWTVQHARPGEFLLMIAMSNGGSVVEWYRRVFAGTGGGEAEADPAHSGGLSGIPAGVGDVPPGSVGVMFLPHLIGAVGVHQGPEYSGCILGLRHGTGRAQIFRALLEAVAYETRWSLDVLDELGMPASRLRMIGGATRSPIWSQIVADVTGLEVLVPDQTECAVLGAARLAQGGVGIEMLDGSKYAQIERRCEPNPKVVPIYRKGYEVYQRVHRNMRDSLVELNSLLSYGQG